MLNDKDMDVLIRRYAKGAAPNTPVEHPDADELNAFAEGALPAMARQRYLSHFADCDDCRKLVSQLAVTAGAPAEVRIPASEPAAEPWWRKLSILFAPATMRYAAFAAVLLAVVGVAFLVWRRPESKRADTALVAQNQKPSSPAAEIQTARDQDASAGKELTETTTHAVPQATVAPFADQKQASPPPPAKPVDALAASGPAPVIAGAARADEPRVEPSPSYAPAPPVTNYRLEDRGREQPNVGASPGGPRRNESNDKYKEMDRSRSGDFAKNRDENQERLANQPATQTKDDSEAARTSSRLLRSRSESEPKAKSEAGAAEEEPETRSAGGRKFKRQGKAWVDSKFKSSMSVMSVARGSEDFDKLDSGLRSIANQLSGEIVVVWKGKAYRIR